MIEVCSANYNSVSNKVVSLPQPSTSSVGKIIICVKITSNDFDL